MNDAILKPNIRGLLPIATGKVREMYDLDDRLLMVTSDRISAYDSIMPTGIPDKGRVLTQISAFWFGHLRPLVSHHLISAHDEFILTALQEFGVKVDSSDAEQLTGRSMLTVKAEIFPVECVARGTISGSLWKEYLEAGGPHKPVEVHGNKFPGGLRESDRLPSPIFTPATKAESGHDENISFEQMSAVVGLADALKLRELTLELYSAASKRAEDRGIIIADTKFEFGMHRGTITLCDEALTPDSSRFWEAADYHPGSPQASYDKQYLRDWLTESGWNREPPAPPLPDEVVQRTRQKYIAAYERITGKNFDANGTTVIAPLPMKSP